MVKSQTDRQTDRQKVMHMSPPCIRTGGLKNRKQPEINVRGQGPKSVKRPGSQTSANYQDEYCHKDVEEKISI